MKIYLIWASCLLFFTAAVCCDAADSASAPWLSCAEVQSLAVEEPDQRIEIAARGFSVLPPQGEHWCYRLTGTAGVSFFKIPNIESASDTMPTREEVYAARMFSAMAMSLKGFGEIVINLRNSDDLITSVKTMIDGHIFPQILDGVQSPRHRYTVLDSGLTTVSVAKATCVKFDASVRETGNSLAPNLIFVLRFPGNLVCRHPMAQDLGPIWLGVVERHMEGEKPAELTVNYEAYLQSVQFTSPR